MQPTRFACDRCRGQKLRCQRENGFYQPCKRCRKADVACLDSPQVGTSQVHRMPNTYLPGYEMTQERERFEPSSSNALQPGNGEMFSMLPENTFRTGEAQLSHLAGIGPDMQFGHVSDFDLSATSMTSWSQWDNQESSSSNDVQSPKSVWPEGFNLSRVTPGDGQELPHALRAASPSPISEYAQNSRIESVTSNQDDRRETKDREFAWSRMQRKDMHTAAENNADVSLGRQATEIKSYISGDSEIKQLLELAQSLCTQQKALEAAPWAKCLSALSLTASPNPSAIPIEEARAAKPIGDILSSSEIFLEIMSRFQTSNCAHSSTGEPAPDMFTSSDPFMGGTEFGMDSNLRQNARDVPADEPSSKQPTQSSARSHSSSSSVVPTLEQLDTTTILLILTCYIRLLFIYTTLLSNINIYLSSPSILTKYASRAISNAGVNADPEPLHIGGFSLHSYGEIQIKVLVDISVHFIRSMEQILGAPQKYTLMNIAEDGMDLDERADGAETLSMRPQMRILMETVMRTVELDNEGDGDAPRWEFATLRGEYKKLQKMYKWKL